MQPFESSRCYIQFTWSSAENFPEGEATSKFAYPFQDDAMQMNDHKALYSFYTTKKIPYVTTIVSAG